MKAQGTEQGLQDAFLGCLREVPFVEDIRIRESAPFGPDLEADVCVRGKTLQFLIEYKTIGQPRRLGRV